ncbi:hypothetical protein FALCPG4_004431 [Fusarium falciforme]
MASNEHENPVTTTRKQILRIVESISNSNRAKSLALINSRAELDFRLRLALFELGNDRSLSQNNESLSTFAGSILEVLRGFDGKDNDGRLKTEVPHRRSQPTLARSSCDEAEPPKQSSIRLPETAEGLTAVAQQISGLRKANSSRPDVPLDLEVGHDRTTTHPRATIREGYDVNKGYESEKENEHHSFQTSEVGLSRTDRGPNYSVHRKVPKLLSMTDNQLLGVKFMDQAYKFYEENIEPLKKKKRSIKVAVIDTGVNQKAKHFKGVRGENGTSIIKTRSFIGGGSDDEDGHGTQVAALIVDVAPHVDLYIAKVSKSREGTNEDKFAEAIIWAIELKVDIINISAAIEDKVETRDAIGEAERLGIIVLAAASNSGANESRVFPACMDTVLAIHATDGNGIPCGFNPSPLENAVNFSTLGTGTPSPLPGDNFLESGTSFSTPIAAGMAANILTLAEALFDESDNEGRTWYNAHKREGMKAIFKHVSQLHHGYDYLCFNRLGRYANRLWLEDVLEGK